MITSSKSVAFLPSSITNNLPIDKSSSHSSALTIFDVLMSSVLPSKYFLHSASITPNS